MIALAYTPVWVWAILALLIHRGVTAARPNTTTPLRLILLPLSFSVWSAVSLARIDDGLALALPAAALGLVAGSAAGWRLFAGLPGFAYHHATGRLFRPGSWLMLVVSLAAFALKFGMAMAAATAAESTGSATWLVARGAVAGAASGLLWGATVTQLLLALRSNPAPQVSTIVEA